MRARIHHAPWCVTVAVAASLAVAACAPPASTSSSSGSGKGASSATSATDLGGMDKLVAAAKKEGTLNVIALPPDWANYGAIISAFKSKYGITVNSAQPDASSADEITAAQRLKGQSSAPDVFDLSATVANANTSMFAAYKVATFDSVPANLKDASGTWVNDYGGYMSIGYDSSKVPAPTSVADLLKPAYKGKVALNGDPTKAGAAFAGVQMVSVASGGTVADVAKGVDFFKKLKAAGNFLPVDPTPATIASGQTPVVFDWDYLNAAQSAKVKNWKVFVPQNAVVGGYYVQAVNKDAPHAAAARLWQEFLYSDAGQNLWLKGGARPVRFDDLKKAGTLDQTAAAALPAVSGTATIPTKDESATAKAYLAANWANAIG
jgi:putative spermidine/putrescine transport system substrate-binding protein